MSADQVARHLHIGRTRILDFEKAEAEDRITLGSLKKVAEAMGCKLVYAIVPESGTILQLAEKRARDEASKRVTAVEHSMALENQAEGNLDEVIEEETKRILGTS
jgi:predicted DNA-binding mobile mystery protein A